MNPLPSTGGILFPVFRGGRRRTSLNNPVPQGAPDLLWPAAWGSSPILLAREMLCPLSLPVHPQTDRMSRWRSRAAKGGPPVGEAGGTLAPEGGAGKSCPDSWPWEEGVLPPTSRESSIQGPPRGASPVNPFLARLQNYSSKAFATRSKLFLISHGIYRESSARKEGGIKIT